MWWFWWWLLFVLLFLLIPLGYGWGYRDWGWPRYTRRPVSREERLRAAEAEREEAAAEAVGWGLFAIFFWIFFLVALFWLVLAVATAG